MLKPFHKRNNCRLCEATDLELVVPITATPVADAYVPKEALSETQESYPLDLYQCLSCGHVQLRDVVAPEILFTKYSYFTGRTGGLLKHFKEYAERVVGKNEVPKGSLVVDVGSNDGTFLRCFLELGMKVLGVDPAENIAAAANASGIETLTAFFSEEIAKRIRAERGPAKVVSANNVFAHTDDMGGMADAVRTLLADDGVFVFEVSYLLDVVEQMLLGTIFHEHVCYHSVKPLDAFLRRHGMELIDVHRVGIQGGSIIGTAQLLGGPRKVEPAVAELKALEDKADLHNPATLRAFSSKIETIRADVTQLVSQLHANGKIIAGFGAARSGTFLIYHFNLGEILTFIVDDSPDKQGLYSPGYHIPVLPTSTLYERKPDYAFILAWVHSRAIIQNHQRFLDEGGQFIVCFPRIQVVSRDAPL
jgi:SAM-dependent methyltransferase